MPTVPTFAVRETNASRHNGGTRGSPLCRETSVSRTANVGTVGKNWLSGPKLSLEGFKGNLNLRNLSLTLNTAIFDSVTLSRARGSWAQRAEEEGITHTYWVGGFGSLFNTLKFNI